MVWCWLAVAEMVVNYYTFDDSPSQCRMMEQGYRLPRGTCCGNRDRCARTGALPEIQAIINHYGGRTSRLTGPPPRPSAIVRALKANRLLIAALGNGFGGGHVVLIRGIRLVEEHGHRRVYLLVNDPMSRVPAKVPLEELQRVWQATIIVHDRDDDD